MKHSTTLTETIRKRAEATHKGEHWATHWLTTAYALRTELVAEGLHNSAECVERIIADTQRKTDAKMIEAHWERMAELDEAASYDA